LSRFNKCAYPAEKGRVIFLYPAVEKCLIVIEYETVCSVTEISSNAEGGDGLGKALGPFPQPDRINMGIADKVECFFQIGLTTYDLSFMYQTGRHRAAWC